MNPLWQISTDRFRNDRESIMRMGNVYQIANGYMGYRGTLDEFGPDELAGITLAGLFDRVGGAWREPVNAPNGGFTQLLVDGQTISARTTPIKRHRQCLHLENAVFERETTYRSRGKSVTVKSSRFLSASQPNLGIVQYSFRCDKTAKVVIRTGIDCNIWDLNGPHLKRIVCGKTGEVLTVQAVTHEAAKKVAVAEILDVDFGKQKHVVRGKKNLWEITIRAEANKVYTFHKFFAVFTDNDCAGPSAKEAAVNCVREAKRLGCQACLERHTAGWAGKWARCDVKIEGDAAAQLALRYSIFQLLIAAPVKGSANSIPARALSGQVYKGAVFWDTEMFMFPFFLHTCPEKAVELLRYRIKTLDGARRKARTEGVGFQGAFYAWESQETGDDACTYFKIGDPFTRRDLRTHFRDKQIHISGDIAIAMWEYFKVTGDDTLLLEGGAEVILECARFYYSYAYFNKNKSRYEILDVVGPDEYHERVNNNAFTNRVVQAAFEIAGATAAYLKQRHPDKLNALLEKIQIAGELPLFTEAAAQLYVPQPDPKTGVIEQFDTYFKLEDIPVGKLKSRMAHPNEYLGAGQGLAVPTKVIKQADVVMMLNLFKDRYSPAIKQANWEYYEPRTEHGSSLSACAYAMVAADIGKLDWAYKYFLKTARIDLEAKYKVFAGTIFMGGSHPAANGGAWMTAVFGFGGVSAKETQVVIAPRLCKKWKSLAFNLVFKGDCFGVKITPAQVAITAGRSNKAAREFLVGPRTVACAPGNSLAVKY